MAVDVCRRRRGITLVEVMAASLIFAITIAGAFSLWAGGFVSIARTNQESICAELARADLEKARSTGFWNLPTGTLASGTGTYTGTTYTSTQTGEWYDVSGNFISYKTTGSPNPPSNAQYKLVRVTTDTGVAAGSGSTYSIGQDSVRIVVTTVTRLSDNTTVFVLGTELVNNGL